MLANFLQTDNGSKILASPRLRAAEGKKTSLKIGTEVPVPVTTFSAQNTGGIGGTFAPATSFQYRNVGVNLEIPPERRRTATSCSRWPRSSAFPARRRESARRLLPTFLTRNVNGTLRLRDRETALLGGLLQESETETFSGIIGLQSIPILNRLLTGAEKRKTTNEILFSITPHLVRAPKISEEDLRTQFIGTQEVLRVPGASDDIFGAPEPSVSPSPLVGSPAPPPGPSTGRPGGRVALDARRRRARTPAATRPRRRRWCRRRCRRASPTSSRCPAPAPG